MKMIFDLGMHRGDDAGFYLRKGFKVIAVEPFPEYVSAAKVKFAKEIETGQLTLVQKALSDHADNTVTLFVNKDKDDSHTTRGDIVSANISANVFAYENLTVQGVTLGDLFDQYGVPYYLKCDIEGTDERVIDQLSLDRRRPEFISFEIQTVDIIRQMKEAGYRSFQLVNQWLNPTLAMPNPPREGSFVELQFNGHMSGLFGRELPADKWTGSERTMRLYELWIEIQQLDPSFAIGGWADCHASMLSPEQLRG